MFRIFFDEKGRVTQVKVLASMGHPELDAVTIKTLMRWKARPGPAREVDIPVTFMPGSRPTPGSTHGHGPLALPPI